MRKLRRVALAVFLVACGSRTGLLVNGEELTEDEDSGLKDSGIHKDASIDHTDAEPSTDALPPLDVQPPVDVVISHLGCPDADATLVYVITESNDLYSFYPTDGTFTKIGSIACPAAPGTTPFSMAVDRKGVAFIEFNDGSLYQVSTLTAACTGTPYAAGQQGISTFGMGYSTNGLGPDETLYIASDGDTTGGTSALGAIDTTQFILSVVAPFSPQLSRAELTGTGDGRLFAFYSQDGTSGSFVGEIDKTSANVVAQTPLPTVDQGQGWAFAFWGGDFYLFTSPDGNGSSVTQFDPNTGDVSVVGTLPTIVVGAGVSTCAPQQ